MPAEGGGTPPSTAGLPTVAASSGADPTQLLGWWSVAGADEPFGTTVQLSLGDIELHRPCGVLSGDWRANEDGLFRADLWSWNGDCKVGGLPSLSPPWIADAVSFRVDGARRQLLDSSGATLATLEAASTDSPGPDGEGPLPYPASSPEVTQQAFATPEALPSGVTPADAGSLLGSWHSVEPSEAVATTPFLEVRPDGTYLGSDGCNGRGGRWVLGPAGELLATTGASSLVFCGGVDPAGDFGDASRVGFAGDQLVLYDAKGRELERLSRAS